MRRRFPAKVPFFLVIALAGGCGGDEGILGVSVPGAPARIVLVTEGATGGQFYADQLSVDSATARYEAVRCTGSVGGGCNEVERATGEVQLELLERLFEIAQSREFRNLRDVYDRPGDAIPPDGWGSALTVTVAERSRTIRWESGATRPELLVRFQCLLLAERAPPSEC